ncbi:inositol-pentakisphosphate 2-kinase-like [Lineus longissimus]|uniref:inositol-pentakisphosphate 2-kinase-like n=1 Tax=Lineus longissimus TaxID=88925 RepID=UPI002B4C2EE8
MEGVTNGSTDLPVAEWVYRGAGNRNVVFANVKEGMVYRLMKRKVTDNTDTDEEGTSEQEKAHETLLNIETYVNNVVRSRLHFVPPMEVVKLPDCLVQHMNGVMQSRKTDQNDLGLHISCPYALRIPDLCIFQTTVTDGRPTFCIELKPKCAWNYNLSTVEMPMCRCCLRQVDKVTDGTYPALSEYCPTDLFSGTKERMNRALMSLLKTPQHKIRIFKDGDVVYDENSSSFPTGDLCKHFGDAGSHNAKESVVDILRKVLIHVNCDTNGDNRSRRRSCHRLNVTCDRTGSCDNTCDDELPDGCILSDLLHGVFYTGPEDIRLTYKLYKKLRRHLQDNPQDGTNLSPEGPFTDDWASIPDGVEEDTLQYAAAKVRQYRVFNTMRLCAIMITLRPLSPEEAMSADDSRDIACDDYGNYFEFLRGFIDLDPKPCAKLEEEYQWLKRLAKLKYGYYSSSSKKGEKVAAETDS